MPGVTQQTVRKLYCTLATTSNRCIHALASMWWPRTGTDGVYVCRIECSALFNQIIIHRSLWSSLFALHLCSWRNVAFTLGKNNIKLHKHPAVELCSALQRLSAAGRLSSETQNKCTFFFFQSLKFNSELLRSQRILMRLQVFINQECTSVPLALSCRAAQLSAAEQQLSSSGALGNQKTTICKAMQHFFFTYVEYFYLYV